jgi:hypothetical protein
VYSTTYLAFSLPLVVIGDMGASMLLPIAALQLGTANQPRSG